MNGTYRLYGRAGTGSAAPEAALAEAGITFELIDVPSDRDAARLAGFHAVNPRGQVPALVLPDGSAIAEGTAILLHIADAKPGSGLAPPPGSFARAHHDRWLLFLQANVYEGILRLFYSDRYTADPAGAGAVSAAAEDYVKRHFELFEAELGDGPFTCGAGLSVLDLYLWMLAGWVDQDWLAAACPKVRRIADRVAGRPLVAPVQQRHAG